MKILIAWLFASVILIGCGSGDFRVNPSAGTLSDLEGNLEEPSNAKDFFTQKLFPIMTASTGNKGCAASGCHAKDNSSNSGTKPFWINSSDSEDSWKWAQVRRTSPVAETTYSNAGDLTIKQKFDEGHENAANWTAAEKALINQWIAFTE